MVFELCIRSARALFYLVLLLPVCVGVMGIVLPAVGYFPALGETEFSLTAVHRLLAVEGLPKMVLLALFTSISATVIALLCTIALLAQFYQRPALQIIQHGLSPVLAIPHAATAIGIGFVLAPTGWVARLIASVTESWQLPPQSSLLYDSQGVAIILALAIKELPFILLMALGVLSQPHLKARLAAQFAVAQSLGYQRQTAFIYAVFPVVYSQLKLPIIAVLAYASASVEIPLLLGPQNPPTLAVAILQWFNHIDLSMRLLASAAACLQLLVTAGAVGLWLLAERVAKLFFTGLVVSGARGDGARLIAFCAWLTASVMALMISVFLVSLLSWSVAGYWPYPQLLPGSVTVQHWHTAAQALADPLANTVWLAGLATPIAVVLVLLFLEGESVAQRRQRRYFTVDQVLFIPLIVPGVAFLYGLVWCTQWLLPGHVWLPTVVSHLIYVLPYVFLSLAVAYRRLDIRFINVASSLGASPWQVFLQVKLPMLFAPVMVAAALGAAISFGQYLPTLLASGGRLATLTTEAVATASGGSRRLTAVYAIMQMLLPLAGFVLAWLLPRVLFNPAQRHHTGAK